MNVVVVVLILLVVICAGVKVLGSHRWNSETRELRARLAVARSPVQPKAVDFRELEDLPKPVQRFFRAALTDGQPMVAGVRIRHQGTFNISAAADQWKPFTSDQQIIVQRPGFDWDGRIAIAPGLRVHVHDTYIAGEGLLHASLLGLLSLANARGTSVLAEGELMRFCAEATWYPTVLLPSQGVLWDPVDDCSANATLSDGSASVTLLFTFNASCLVETVRAKARGRLVNGKIVPTRWEGRFWSYSERDGMHIPMEGAVAWLLPEGNKPYWRGHISEIAYEFTR